MPNLFSLLWEKWRRRALFTTDLVCMDLDSDVDTEELEALNPLHYSPFDVNGASSVLRVL
jgi:hypothetical protein